MAFFIILLPHFMFSTAVTLPSSSPSAWIGTVILSSAVVTFSSGVMFCKSTMKVISQEGTLSPQPHSQATKLIGMHKYMEGKEYAILLKNTHTYTHANRH